MEGQSTVDGDVLLEELRQLARTRSLADCRRADFPLLAGYSPAESEGSFDDVRDMLGSAIGAIPDPQYRDAAFALLGWHDRRWSSLKARQSDAACAFDIGFEGFRRKRTGDRPSLYEETLQEVANALVQQAPTPVIADLSAGSAELEDDQPPVAATAESRRRGWVAGGRRLAGLAIIGVIAFGIGAVLGRVLSTPGDAAERSQAVGGLDLDRFCSSLFGTEGRAVRVSSDAGGWRCTTVDGETVPIDFGQACGLLFGDGTRARLSDWTDPDGWDCFVTDDEEVALGLFGDDACSIAAGTYLTDTFEEFARYADPFRTAFEANGGAEVLGCPAGPVFARGEGVVQELSRDGRISGAIYAGPSTDVVLLTGAAFDAYQRHGGGHGSSLLLMGFPTAGPTADRGMWVVPGSNGGALVADSEFGAYYLLPQPSWQAWQAAGESLGPPVSDFYGTPEGVRQDFASGYVAIDGDGLQIEVES